MKRHITALLAAAIAALASCTGRGHHSALTSLDSLTETAPEAAAARLDSLAPAMATAQQADRMHFELLRLKAACLTYNPPQSDSTALAIVNYYKNAPSTGRLAEACYYTGKVYLALRDYPEAMNFFHMALDNAPEPDTRLKARTYAQLGYIFRSNRLYADALNAFEKAYVNDSITSDTVGILYCLRDIASIHSDINQADSALQYYAKALQIARTNNITDMTATISGQMASQYCKMGLYAQAHASIKTAIDYNDPYDKNSILHILAKIYNGEGKVDSALACYNTLLSEGNLYTRKNAAYAIYKHYAKTGDFTKEVQYFHEYEKMADSLLNVNAAEAVKQSSNKYNYKLKEKENDKLRSTNQQLSTIITNLTITLIIIIVGILWYITYKIQQRKGLRLKHEKYELLGERAKGNATEIETKRSIIASSEIYKSIVCRLNNPDSKKRLTEDEWKQLSEKVNETYPNFKAKVYELCKMSIADYRLCLLIKIGISPSVRAQILSKTSSGITSARSKLYKRAFGRNGGAADWDAIILSL